MMNEHLPAIALPIKVLKALAVDHAAKTTKREKFRVVLDVDEINPKRLKNFLSDAKSGPKYLLTLAFAAYVVAKWCCDIVGSNQADALLVQKANEHSGDILGALNGTVSNFGIRCSDIHFQQKGDKVRAVLDIRGIVNALNQLLSKSKTGIRCSDIHVQQKGNKTHVALELLGVMSTLNQKASDAGIQFSGITFERIE